MEEELKAGDVVVLKSGGVKMTIEEIREDVDGKNYANCAWFEKSVYKSEKIYLAALKKYEEDVSGGLFIR